MTAVDVDALDKLREAATPGPWHVVQDEDVIEVWSPTAEVAAYSNPADAALIVAAVNALPDLIAALRAVLDKHRPIGGPSHFDGDESDYCDDDGFIWPCPTARAVTAALTSDGGEQ